MKKKIIIALDTRELSRAKNLIDSIPEATFFKVGLESYLSNGPELLKYLREKEKKIFLDLKFKDIPNTVSGAVKSSLIYKPLFLTVHLSGGKEMLRRAVEASSNTETNIVGVSILTSMDNSDMEETCIRYDIETTVRKLIELGLENGITHFVCSPSEIKSLKDRFGAKLHLITPGVRPVWASSDDQKRFSTPAAAVSSGAEYLVIGRPITASTDPRASFIRIISELT